MNINPLSLAKWHNDLIDRHYFFIYDEKSKSLKTDGAYNGKHHCREIIADYYFINSSPIYIGYRYDSYLHKFSSILEFWKTLEDKLNIPLEDRNIIYSTNVSSIFIINVGNFWRINETRRQFFTLFLRCGAAYYFGDFEQSFNNYPLSKSIIKTVNWFLDGNTVEKFSFNKTEKSRAGIVGKYGLIHHYTSIDDNILKERLVREDKISEVKKLEDNPINKNIIQNIIPNPYIKQNQYL